MLNKLLRGLIARKSEKTTAARLQDGYAELLAERYEPARTIASEILAVSPNSFGARLLMAQACAALGEKALALSNIDAGIALQSTNPEGYYVRALIHEAAGRAAQALADFDRVLELDRRHQAALDKKGALHDARGEFESSLACAEQLVQIDSGNAEAHHKRAITLRELGRLAQAEAALRQAIALSPRFTAALAHLALVLIDLGRHEEADDLLARLLADAPHDQEGRWAAAVLDLLQGRFASGWDHYDARESRRDPKLRLADIPDWTGVPIADGALMINAEQGLGDQIMFASCLPDVLATTPACIVSCEARLKPIFERSFQGLHVVAMRTDRPLHATEMPTEEPALLGAARISPLPVRGRGAGGEGSDACSGSGRKVSREPLQASLPVRAQTMMGSLPGIYRRNLDQFPNHAGYLRAAPEAVAVWRDRLSRLGPGLKVGLCWTGGTPKTRRSLRSLRLEQLLPVLSVPDCSFVSLQYVDSADEVAGVLDRHGLVVNDLPGASTDYDQTAALVSALDLVVSVCTAIVHLSGALGKRVWVLAPSIPEWRYGLRGDSMPWYPSARLWRQAPGEDWNAPIEAVARELATLSRSHESTRGNTKGS